MERVSGIDVSRWQGVIQWEQVAAAGHRFAVVRATIGDTYTDPRFFANWDGARDAGLLVSAYHVITPKVSAEAQMTAFFNVLDDRISDLPLVVDVERDDGVEPAKITQCVRDCLREIEVREARRPIIYTARWYWNRFIQSSKEWQAYDLWVASYTSEPLLPRDWSSWRFWQYSQSGRVPGSGSRSTDLNWFAGTEDDLLTYAGTTPVARATAAPGWRMQVVIPKLNVRSGPGTSYKDVGDLHDGDVVEVRRLVGKDVWVQIEPGKWVAYAQKDEPPYMVLLPPEKPKDTV